ncbi:P-loop containing nucleoside triphosphate hydrolase [Syntrophomonas zehnderi OL-4]|uniref:p-loop containing nucleoside triphosphate hydrolase n=1 Tax=Syntrophomonas zehnderi OL-4 TaxID=690567 RepID=A0A0E4GCK8_9FIRM|nr:hypothetical protein [Syntrophomonas zehnderi]CFX16291.1 P-loop containing nucleoside triphosphate hydrolase [Syntrophomonas zehnderi OL-4]
MEFAMIRLFSSKRDEREVIIMYGIIASRDYTGLVERYGTPSFHIREGDLRQALLQAARVQLDFLLVDIDFSRHIEEELHQYRVQRPVTRIILIACGREPGDPLVAKLVCLGVYDIVSEAGEFIEQDLLRTIEKPANYTQAARWLQRGQPYKYQSGKNVSESIKEVLIQRPLGLTTITVAGAGPGAGVSHLCFLIATHLAKSNHRVILAEWPLGDKAGRESQYTYLSAMGAKYENKKIHSIEMKMANMRGFDILPDARSFRSIEHIFPVIAGNVYDYLVLDMGEISSDKVAEMDRAALAILTVNAAPYRLNRFLPMVDEQDISIYTPNLARWRITLNLASEKEMKWFLNAFSKYIGKVYNIPFVTEDSPPEELLQDLLQPVLPINLAGRKKPFSTLTKIFKR